MDRPKDYCRDCWAAWIEFYEAAQRALRMQADGPPRQRPTPHPGPRCVTHWRAERKRRSATTHDKRVQAVYGLSAGQYELLYTGQRGTCAICQRATGRTKRLAVDHNHRTEEVRGLLCGPCNSMLAHARDDPAMFVRAASYLHIPPARQILGGTDDQPPTEDLG